MDLSTKCGRGGCISSTYAGRGLDPWSIIDAAFCFLLPRRAAWAFIRFVNTELPQSIHSAPFSDREFRNALGRFATGVAVVTAVAPDGAKVGLTISSFNSASLAPPLVLWSLANTAASMPVLQTVRHYAVNVLAASQKELALQFARKGVDRWAGVGYYPGVTGVPLLEGAIASFECRNRSRYDEGDHVILVGEVEHCRYRTGMAPLLYHGGNFYTEQLI